MLYFDNAATTWPKPAEVKNAVLSALTYYGANPGRSGHRMAIETAAQVFECRERAATLFGCSEPENVIFTKNCTEALNIAIRSAALGGHCVISDLEHNSVLRPLYKMQLSGKGEFSIAEVDLHSEEQTLANFERAMQRNTRAVVLTGASNVFGIKPPVLKIAKLAHEHGALFILDAAQTAGAEKYDMEQSGIDFICAPGHKGLLGPTGTGILVTKKPEILKPLIFGGTGSYSLDFAQPPDMPERMESGTLNVPGICGLSAGIEKVSAEGESTISEREMQLAQMIYAELFSTKNVTLFTPPPKAATSAAVISFVISDLTGEQTAAELAARGAATRGGFHCAALAHRKFGTEKRGTCRISIGPMNTFDEALKLVRIIHTVAKEN